MPSGGKRPGAGRKPMQNSIIERKFANDALNLEFDALLPKITKVVDKLLESDLKDKNDPARVASLCKLLVFFKSTAPLKVEAKVEQETKFNMEEVLAKVVGNQGTIVTNPIEGGNELPTSGASTEKRGDRDMPAPSDTTKAP